MFDESLIDALADELDRAEAERTQIAQFSQRFPDMSIDDGYRVGRAWVSQKTKAGRSVLGRKIGLTSHAMQAVAGIDEPDYGTLLDDMFFGDAGEIPLARFIDPQVEVELAFRLGETLEGAELTISDVLAATESVVPAIEIIDARIERFNAELGSRRKVQDTIADNAACAGVVVGGHEISPTKADLRWIGAVLSRNGDVVETGLAAGVLGHPAHGVVWLARKLARWGERLEAGQLVLSGSFTRPVEVRRGDVFDADYGPLGSVSFRFE